VSADSAPTPGPTDRQPRETAVAFEAFRAYLELGPARSTAKVARALGKSKTLMDRWSSQWSWVERVRAFDSAAARTTDEAHLEVLARRSKRQAEIAQLHGEASLVVAREVLRRFSDPEQAKVELAKLSPAELLQLEATIGRMHNRAVMTERLALGLTTDQSGEPIPRQAAEEAAARLSEEELDAQLAGVDMVAAARERRAARKAAG
jgi:hypothetical protein